MELTAGYKQTELGVIPEDWEVERLGNICLYQNGIAQEQYFNSNNGYKVVSIGNFLPSGKFAETNTYINKQYKKFISKFILNTGDLAMILNDKTSIGAIIGRVLLIDANDTYVMNQRTMRLKPLGKIFSKYLYFLINSDFIHKSIVNLSRPGTQIYVNTEDITSLQVFYPPTKTEQTAIAKALTDVDDLLESLDKLIAKKRDIKQATMQQLLTGKTRLPSFDNNQGYKQTELGVIPEDWEVRELKNICSAITRGASPRPIQDTKWFSEKSNIGWVRISDITKTNRYLKITSQKLSNIGVKNSRFVEIGNLIMSICATVGKPIETKINVCIHDGFVVFEKILINQSYLFYILKSIELQWSLIGQKGSQINLNTSIIGNKNIIIPPTKTEQTTIAKVLTKLDDEIEALEQRRNKLTNLKQGMMQQLLTGKIRLIKPKQHKE